MYVTVLMRGVDPHSTAQPMKIGLGRIFGKQNHWSYTVEGNFKMNIPLQPNDGLDFGDTGITSGSQDTATDRAHRCVKHNNIGRKIVLQIISFQTKSTTVGTFQYHFCI